MPNKIEKWPDFMNVKKLRAFNMLAAKHVTQFGTREDFKILLEIAACHGEGACLTLKQLVLCVDIPESTLKRRLARLVRLKFAVKQMLPSDRRVHCYTLPEKTLKVFDGLVRDIRAFTWD
jgi:DNA-binding MarR family transcriptional regulator